MQKDMLHFSLIFLVLVISMFNSTKADNIDSTSLSVELDIPDYIPGADELRHSNKFFSGQPLRLAGDFAGIDPESVTVRVWGTNTGVTRTLELRKVRSTYVSVNVPPDIPTDLYDVVLDASGKAYLGRVEIQGFTEDELRDMAEMGGGGVDEAPLAAAVLYSTKLNCG
ncbi:MAG: hypothetical protein AABX83_04275, partial [Nanoarchaeota archaeon]